MNRLALLLVHLLLGFCLPYFPVLAQKKVIPKDSITNAPSILATPNANAFDAKPFVPNLIPPSPEAAALNKFGDIPVGLYTGLPSIEIPIYGINYKRLSVPISLNYHASGLKVEEVASWVGLGWSLNAGGMVSRTVMGLPDDRPVLTFLNGYGAGGYLNDATPDSYYQNADILQGSSREIDRDLYDQIVVDNQRDVQPDVYNYSLPNRSGRFYIDRKAKNVGVPIPSAPIQITPRYSSVGAFIGFDIKDENGVKYSFDDDYKETSQSAGPGGDYAVTGWMLHKITSPTGEEALFTYESYTHSLTQFKGCSRFLFAGGLSEDARVAGHDPPVTQYSLSKPTINGWYVSTIAFPEGKVVFEASVANRQDISTKSLSSVKIYDQGNTLVKQVDLTYSYFTENGGFPTPFAQMITTASYGSFSRLRLDQVQEKKGSLSMPPYILSYNEGTLPNRLSFAKDYWGYYNGKESNDDYAPKVAAGSTSSPAIQKFFGTADLGANDTFSKVGVLKKITYPTGGSTSLEQEANTTYTTNFNLFRGDSDNTMYEFVDSDYYTGAQYSYSKGDWLRGVDNTTDLVGTLTLANAKTFQFTGSLDEFQQTDNINIYYPFIYFNSTTNPSVKFFFKLNQAALIQLPAGTYNVQIKLNTTIDTPFNLVGHQLDALLLEVNTNPTNVP